MSQVRSPDESVPSIYQRLACSVFNSGVGRHFRFAISDSCCCWGGTVRVRRTVRVPRRTMPAINHGSRHEQTAHPVLVCSSPVQLDVSHVWDLHHRLRHHARDGRVESVVPHLLALGRHQSRDGGGLTRHHELARAVGPEGAPESGPTRGPQRHIAPSASLPARGTR
jgi:hypothetical protein